MTSALNRYSKSALVLCTGARLSAGTNASKLICIAIQHLVILVIDHINFINAESTDAAPRPAASSSSWSRILHFSNSLF